MGGVNSLFVLALFIIFGILSISFVFAEGSTCYLYDGWHGYINNSACLANGCIWTTNATDMYCSAPVGCCIQKECWQFDNTGQQPCQNSSLNGNLSCVWNGFTQTRTLPNGTSYTINGSCVTNWSVSGSQNFSMNDGCWNSDGNKAQCTNALNSPKCEWKSNSLNQNPQCYIKTLNDARIKNILATSNDIGCCESKGCWNYDGNQTLCTNPTYNPSFAGLCTWVPKEEDSWCPNSVGCCKAKFCSEVNGEANCTKLARQMFMPCEYNGTACQQKGESGGGFVFYNTTNSCMSKGGWWNGTGCEMPSAGTGMGGGGGFMFGEGAHCWFASGNQNLCQNITGCVYCASGTGPNGISNSSSNNICNNKGVNSCEGHNSNGGTFANADNSVNLNCTHIQIRSACEFGPLPNCIWQNSSALTGNFCIVGISNTLRPQPPVPFCEHPSAKNNYTLCLDLANIYMMPCKWGNASSNLTATDNCTFNSNAVFGGSASGTMDYNIISSEVSCVSAGGTWKKEYYLDGGKLKQDSWCEKGAMFSFSSGQASANKGNCDTDCWACEFNSTGGRWANESAAQSACQNSAKKICQWKSDANASNGQGWCDYPKEISFGGSQDCNKDCKACEYSGTTSTQVYQACITSVVGCTWMNDSNAPMTGFCISSSKKSCLTDCFACYEQSKCSNSSFHPTTNCSWDSSFKLCKPSGFTGEICFDAIDNDNNGKTDCADSACTYDNFCGGSSIGSGGVDCKKITNSDTCKLTKTASGANCTWIVPSWGAGYCDFPGSSCYLYESTPGSCNITIGCIYRNSSGGFPMPGTKIDSKAFSGGFCDINKTKANVCFNSSNMNSPINCNATNECIWVVDSYNSIGGRCEFKPFYYCGALNSSNCNSSYGGSMCGWRSNAFSSVGGFCETYCAARAQGQCSGLCAWKGSICEPEAFGGMESGGSGAGGVGGGFGCHAYDGNQTACIAQNMSCGWMSFTANTSAGVCQPKGEQIMMQGMDNGPPKILGQDTNDTNTPEIDIRMYGVKDSTASLGFGITVTNITNAAVCRGYYVGGMGVPGQQPRIANGSSTTKYYWYLDTNKNTSDGCNATKVDSTKIAGFEFLIKYTISLDNITVAESKSFYKCVSGSWVLTNVPLTSSRQMMCSMMIPFSGQSSLVGGVMILVDKQNLESFTEYNKTTPARVFVSTANSSNSEVNPVDDAAIGYYTPGTADFKFIDCSNPNVKDAKCKNFQKFGFNVFEDCKNGKDDDSDGLTDCSDPKCKFTPVCSGGSGSAFNFSADANDNQAPTVTYTQVDVLPDAAFIKFDTDEPANGTVDFYYNDSTCSSINITKNDSGDPTVTFDDFKPFHLVPIDQINIGYSLTNGTIYYYKTTVCDPTGNCGTSACLNFTTTSVSTYKNFIFRMDLPPGYNVSIPTLNYSGNFTTSVGGTSYPIGIKTNASVSRNINITVNCGNQSLTFVGADILKPKSIDMENAFICNGTGNILGMNSTSKSWNQLIGDIGMGGQSDYIKLTYPIAYSSDNNITWCDDGLTNCTAVNSYTNCSSGGTGKTDCKIPTSLGFSAYQISTPSTPASDSGSSSGGGGGGSGGSSAKIFNFTEAELLSGATKELAKSDKLAYTILRKIYYVSATGIASNEINITVSTGSVKKTITIGAQTTLDVNNDKVDDVVLKYESYNQITKKATLYTKKYAAPATSAPATGNAVEEIPETNQPVSETQGLPESSGNNWVWIAVIIAIVIVVIVAIIIVALSLIFKKTSQRKKYY